MTNEFSSEGLARIEIRNHDRAALAEVLRRDAFDEEFDLRNAGTWPAVKHKHRFGRHQHTMASVSFETHTIASYSKLAQEGVDHEHYDWER